MIFIQSQQLLVLVVISLLSLFLFGCSSSNQNTIEALENDDLVTDASNSENLSNGVDVTTLEVNKTGAVTTIANPASTFCIEHGGKLRIVDTIDGQMGLCVFSNGSECEEWKYFRGECSPKKSGNTSEIKENSIDLACENDSDCVPAGCCHPKSCTHVSKEANCAAVMCTMNCEPGTLDCGQGSCKCQNGICNAVFS